MKALVITDGTESIQSIALLIKESLESFSVKICSAQDFQGTDLLAAGVFFIGCEKSSPSSFAFLEEMLNHINLASRKCGIFSSKEKTIKYLHNILKSCEADTFELLTPENSNIKKTDIKKWLKPFLK